MVVDVVMHHSEVSPLVVWSGSIHGWLRRRKKRRWGCCRREAGPPPPLPLLLPPAAGVWEASRRPGSCYHRVIHHPPLPGSTHWQSHAALCWPWLQRVCVCVCVCDKTVRHTISMYYTLIYSNSCLQSSSLEMMTNIHTHYNCLG